MACFFIFVVMNSNKKYLTLGVLFILPLLAYMFFASGVNNFLRLPTINENALVVNEFTNTEGDSISLKNNISIISFFGHDIDTTQVFAFNLKEKIYDKNKDFKDFQFVSFIAPGYDEEIEEFKYQINQTSDAYKWNFVELPPDKIKDVFNALGTDKKLSDDYSSNYAFIIGKSGALRGRTNDEDTGVKYGYNMASVADLDKKMEDDVKIILAEYRLALKKNDQYK